MNKARTFDNSERVDQVVESTKKFLRKNGFKNEAEVKEQVKLFLQKRGLSLVTVRLRRHNKKLLACYVDFSFDNTIIESKTLHQKICF